ncbi:hypothetical protein PanWU01x14_235670 [Parasponia andersonii]|uniref:Transmembrane protein n=1 Tax=Parasponia andersonii TaxID=3476 RepID=A0A2P5BIT1_PARAD|nr:hypothetical protein PanWU01x14_235670 [Parasponia andersonii]
MPVPFQPNQTHVISAQNYHSSLQLPLSSPTFSPWPLLFIVHLAAACRRARRRKRKTSRGKSFGVPYLVNI